MSEELNFEAIQFTPAEQAEVQVFLDSKRFTPEEQAAIRLLLAKGLITLHDVMGD